MKCKKCGEKLEMYYTVYCPKCDKEKIVKGPHGSWSIIPMLHYGEKYLGLNKGNYTWAHLCMIYDIHNDMYLDLGPFTEEVNDPERELITLFKDYGMDIAKKSVFLHISW